VARIVLYDLADATSWLVVGRRQWRATLQLFYRDGVFTKEQVARLGWRLGGAGTSISAVECRTAGKFLSESVIPPLAGSEGVRVEEGPGGFDEVTDGTMTRGLRQRPDVSEGERSGTLLPRAWLVELATFLFQCDGAGALEETFAHGSHAQQPGAQESRGRPTKG
jgi:hypothetical protein